MTKLQRHQIWRKHRDEVSISDIALPKVSTFLIRKSLIRLKYMGAGLAKNASLTVIDVLVCLEEELAYRAKYDVVSGKEEDCITDHYNSSIVQEIIRHRESFTILFDDKPNNPESFLLSEMTDEQMRDGIARSTSGLLMCLENIKKRTPGFDARIGYWSTILDVLRAEFDYRKKKEDSTYKPELDPDNPLSKYGIGE